MSLLNRAKADIRKITTAQNEWGVTLSFQALTGESAVITGLKKKHHTGFDTEGRRVSARDATVTVVESLLVEAGYPVRNENNEVFLRDHRVTVADSTGVDRTYVIEEWYPDETLGIIVCQLGNYV